VKARALLIPLLIAGCDRVENTFDVQAPGASSAELQLCGKVTRLDQSSDRFSAARAIDCEGDGKIIVRLQGRPAVSCVVGYVTPGAVQHFRFSIDGDQCGPSL
jgi:hypothetical protein